MLVGLLLLRAQIADVDHLVALLGWGRDIPENRGAVQAGFGDLGQAVDDIVVLGALALD